MTGERAELREKENPYELGASLVAQLVKNPPAIHLGLIPGLGRSPGEGNGYPLQYSGLDYTVHGVTELDTTERLSLLLSSLMNLG